MKYIFNREVIRGWTRTVYKPPYIAYDVFGGRVYDSDYLVEGGYIPSYLGRAYEEVALYATVYYPIPLNYVVRVLRVMYWKIMRGFYWLGLIDVGLGERFTWGDFYRIKTH